MSADRPQRQQLLELEAAWAAVARRLLSRRWAEPNLDITHPEYFALHHVCQQRVVTLVQLADALDLPQAAAGRVTDRLVRAGLVQRRLMPEDRRTILVEPTGRGREVLATIRRVRFDEFASIMQRLDPAERDELVRLFRKMAGESDASPPQAEDNDLLGRTEHQ